MQSPQSSSAILALTHLKQKLNCFQVRSLVSQRYCKRGTTFFDFYHRYQAESNGSLQDFNEQKRKEQQKLEEIKSKLDRISEQVEPDEVEEDYFRKTQEDDVGASNSDLQTDNADDDGTHMPERRR